MANHIIKITLFPVNTLLQLQKIAGGNPTFIIKIFAMLRQVKKKQKV